VRVNLVIIQGVGQNRSANKQI